MQVVTALNSYNLGDLITMLPGFQMLYHKYGTPLRLYQRLDLPAFYYEGAEHPIKNESGQQVCMNKETFEWVKPLLESQKYIESYNIWDGESVEYQMDKTRDRRTVPLPYGNIHHWPWFVYHDLACNLSTEWIKASQSSYLDVYTDYVLINRTSRYQNPYIHYYFLKKYENRLLFVGTPKEHGEFCEKWGLKIIHLPVANAHNLAIQMDISRGFIGNQSFMWHLADAMKIPRVLEYCNVFPNTHPTGNDGFAALYQEGLEYYVEKLFA